MDPRASALAKISYRQSALTLQGDSSRHARGVRLGEAAPGKSPKRVPTILDSKYRRRENLSPPLSLGLSVLCDLPGGTRACYSKSRTDSPWMPQASPAAGRYRATARVLGSLNSSNGTFPAASRISFLLICLGIPPPSTKVTSPSNRYDKMADTFWYTPHPGYPRHARRTARRPAAAGVRPGQPVR